MSKAKHKRSPMPQPTSDKPKDREDKHRTKKIAAAAKSDIELIRACVRYASLFAAGNCAFKADPDGNSNTAGELSGEFHAQASAAMAKATALEAQSFGGLAAKARCVMSCLDQCHGSMDEDEAAFRRSFAQDVSRLGDDEQSWSWAAFVETARQLHLKKLEDAELRWAQKECQ